MNAIQHHGFVSVVTTEKERIKVCTCQLNNAEVQKGRVEVDTVTQRDEDCPFTHG